MPARNAVDAVLAAITQSGRARVLEIGTGLGDSGLAIARALPAGGMLITLERDPVRAQQARARFADAALADKATVMIGDASRYLHKLAGPFDTVFQDGDPERFESMHERLVALLQSSGTLVTNNMNRAGAYNETLAADSRLRSTFLQVGNGVAVSVKITDDARVSERRGLEPRLRDVK